MPTEPISPPAPNGFTLIEVLVAMVILAVGLLGLEALGIGAARSIVQADEQSKLTLLATQVMEDQIRAIRADPLAVVADGARACGVDEETGYEFCSFLRGAGMPPSTIRVEVEVWETAEDPEPFMINSYVYDPDLP